MDPGVSRDLCSDYKKEETARQRALAAGALQREDLSCVRLPARPTPQGLCPRSAQPVWVGFFCIQFKKKSICIAMCFI